MIALPNGYNLFIDYIISSSIYINNLGWWIVCVVSYSLCSGGGVVVLEGTIRGTSSDY